MYCSRVAERRFVRVVGHTLIHTLDYLVLLHKSTAKAWSELIFDLDYHVFCSILVNWPDSICAVIVQV